MTPTLRRLAVPFLLLPAVIALGASPAAARKREPPADPKAHVYPTTDRVSYALACLRDHPGPQHEMVSKCSCTIDEIAKVMTFDDYIATSTSVNAISIGGERGGTLRDAEHVQAMAKRFREAQTKAKKACFVIP
jgi:hypothetical protein